MKQQQDIFTQIDRRDGMTVPEGYFADFAERMASSLPVTDYEKSQHYPLSVPERSFWVKVKPYVYMAAMFMGVWLMLKTFTMLTSTVDKTDDPMPALAEALSNDSFVYDYIFSAIDDREIIYDMMDEDLDIDALGDSIGDISGDKHLEFSSLSNQDTHRRPSSI